MTIVCDRCGMEIKWASGRGNRPYSAMAEMPKGLTRIRIDLCRSCAQDVAGQFAQWKKGESAAEEDEDE